MGRRVALALAISILLLGIRLTNVYASDNKNDLSVSQVNINMPEIKVYLNGIINQEEAKESEAYLGNTKLEYSHTGVTNEENIYYYILLDVSASIKDEEFKFIKQGINEFVQTLRVDDGFSLISFGDDVKNITSDKGQLSDILMGIDNNDQNTLLFEAIELASETAEKEKSYQRKVIIAITDGEDFSLGQSTSNEALKSLEKRGIPLYAVAVNNGEREHINSFGEFARNSGGNIWILENNNCLQNLEDIKSLIEKSSYLLYYAPSNRVSNTIEILNLSFPDQEIPCSKNVLVSKWKTDSNAPEIIDVEKTADNKISISFSEKVLNADEISSWKISWNGEEIPVQSIVKENEENTFTLSFKEKLYQGSYAIEGVGIRDDSQEENSLTGIYSIELEGETYAEPKGDNNNMQYVSYLLITVIIVVIIIAVFCVVYIYKKVKKNKGIIYVEGKSVLVSNVEKHEKVKVVQNKGKDIDIIVDVDGRNMQKIKTNIDRSLFVGRASINNLYFEDVSLSRQHFVLEYENGNMFVTDLNSANKTKINGIPISKKRKLDHGDVITAGQLNFRIKW